MLDGSYTEEEAREDLRAALSAVLEEEIPPLSNEMNLFKEFHLDSMSLFESLMELEDRLGFNVDPEELDIKDFETAGGYASFLVAQCNSTDS